MTSQEKAKQQAEVMLAYANGAEIEYTDVQNPWKLCTDPNWDWLRSRYRVKKPAPKVVKLWAYVGPYGQLERRFEGMKISNWKRAPQFDLEYTEDES